MGYKVKNVNIEVGTNLINRLSGAGIEINLPGEEQSILDVLKDDPEEEQEEPVKEKKTTKKKREDK